MPSEQADMAAAQAQQYDPQTSADPQAAMQGPDLSALSPQQQQAYQDAFQQAMEAQQLYAKAQEDYLQAQQSGNEQLAQEAYQQALNAQQMYGQAHQIYLSILEQAQQAQAYAAPPQAAPPQAAPPPQEAPPPAISPQPPAIASPPQQGSQGNMPYAQPPQGYPPQQQSYPPQQQGYPPQQQGYPPQPQGYPPQPQGYPPQPQGYPPQPQGYPPQPQGYPPQPQGYPPQPQGYPPQPQGYPPQPQGYPPQPPMYGGSQGSMDQLQAPGYAQQPSYPQPLPTASPEASAAWEEDLDAGTSSNSEGGGGKLFWIFVLAVLAVASYGLYTLTKDDRPKPDLSKFDKPAAPPQTKQDLEQIRRSFLGLDKEKPSPHLRSLVFAKKDAKWNRLVLSGKGDCMTLFLSDGKDVYSGEGGIDPKEPKLLRRPFPEEDFPMNMAPFNSRILDFQFAQGLSGTYLLIRHRIEGRIWLAIYTLLGNPLDEKEKGKKKKDDVTCGSSGHTHVKRENVILLGTGSCKKAAKDLEIKTHLCKEDIDIPEKGAVSFWQSGKVYPPEGSVIIGSTRLDLGPKRFAAEANERSFASRLAVSTPPSPDRKGKRWITLDQGTGILWAFDKKLRQSSLSGPLPTSANKALAAHLEKNTLRVVFPTKLIRFSLKGKQLTEDKSFDFGEKLQIQYATWGNEGKILLFATEKSSIFQYDESP